MTIVAFASNNVSTTEFQNAIRDDNTLKKEWMDRILIGRLCIKNLLPDLIIPERFTSLGVFTRFRCVKIRSV